MIKEVIIVEGKMDILAVNRAVEADSIITDGFHLRKNTLDAIKAAYKKRGIIILTDPDPAGERIRRFLAKRFPNAKHAFIPVEDATANDDIGVEQASPEAIRAALAKVRTESIEPSNIFSSKDMVANNLTGSLNASERRMKLGKILGLGAANAKTFLKRLNTYGVTREEFEEGLNEL
ncbi:MAG: ribonuclease M5 [Selenomonadaceae bacterium]|nr:ribonuclease M5 [Selenomonadaceae bacterium]MBP3723327.1 ribonuclease M5 [Selenomonadaceae bacterium]